jgi:hypothetical protein
MVALDTILIAYNNLLDLHIALVRPDNRCEAFTQVEAQ